MEVGLRYLGDPHACSYLPGQVERLEYDLVLRLSPAEYQERMHQAWRRFGRTLFRPRCRACAACRPLRVDVARFRPDRSQRRARRDNAADIRVEVGPPAVDEARLALYRRYHAHQAQAKGWPDHQGEDAASYRQSFLDNPFPTQEWRHWLGGRLVGVGYVDVLPAGLSAIYFFYDPDHRDRSLGTWNVLSLIEHAAARGLPHVYLGYYIAGSRSMSYKARFAPNQVLGPDGHWRDFRP
jgi:leucyl-tRNA---protein transferase